MPSGHLFIPDRWAVVGAVIGRGLLLVGLSEDNRRALAIASPGVYLETPPGDPNWPEPSTAEGWRVADYISVDDEPVLIDRQRPWDMQVKDLDWVATQVARHAPRHASWLADRLERQVRLSAMSSETRVAGVGPARRADAREMGVEFMLDALDSAHEDSYVSATLGDADPRLAYGVLRRLAAELREHITAETPVGVFGEDADR